MAGLDLPARSIREQIASAVNLVVHLSRMSDGSRRLTEIAEVSGMEGESIALSTLFQLDNRGPGDGDPNYGVLRRTPAGARFAAEMQQVGTPHDQLARAFPGDEI